MNPRSRKDKLLQRIASVAASIISFGCLFRQPVWEDADLFIIDNELKDFDLKPGPWFEAYLCDWMLAHDVIRPQDATSGIARGAKTGDYIWATATPEWDRDWFNVHGWKFPRKWVPFNFLSMSEGEPGGPCLLRGL